MNFPAVIERPSRELIEQPKPPEPLKVVWSPLPGSQTLAMSCPAHVILYHGTRGPGKTDAQLMRFRMRVGQGYGRHWRGVIFDREYKNLDDLVSKSQRWFPEFRDGAKFLGSGADYKWVWKTGEELLFRTVKREADYWNYHGQEFPFIGWNELTKFPNADLYDAMMSCNRSSFRPEDHPIYIDKERYYKEGLTVPVRANHKNAMSYLLPNLPLEVFATCNPYGVGHNWVKKRFINAAPMGRMYENRVKVFNPQKQVEEEVVKRQVHLFGSYRENKFLSPEYIAELESITDPNKKKAWLQGNWDIVSGGMFDDVWDSQTHIIEPFDIPYTWRIDRSFDWGSSAPFSVGWWATSDGSDVKLPNGKWMSTIKGDVFRIREWYGWSGKANQGLHMLASDIAKGIVERELAWGLYERVKPGPADNSIWDAENGNSIAVDMAKPVVIKGQKYKGVQWIRSDKSAGSRIAGWEKCRKYLANGKRPTMKAEDGTIITLPREGPGLFAFNTCKMFIDLFPTLPRDEKNMDDVDTNAEDHLGDEVRYKILSVGAGAKGGKTKGMT